MCNLDKLGTFLFGTIIAIIIAVLISLLIYMFFDHVYEDPRDQAGHCGTCGGLLDYQFKEKDNEDEANKK